MIYFTITSSTPHPPSRHSSVLVKLCSQLPQARDAGQVTLNTAGKWWSQLTSYLHDCHHCHGIILFYLCINVQVTAEVADGSKVFRLLGSYG